MSSWRKAAEMRLADRTDEGADGLQSSFGTTFRSRNQEIGGRNLSFGEIEAEAKAMFGK